MEKWTTKDEIRHLENCGKGKWNKGRRPALIRSKLLRGYQQGAMLKTDWGDMDRDTVLAELDRIMAEEGNGA